ncbi:MAG: 16S rRNA (uracil(1498)-N(3))-methyltransferase, partial [Pseudomonadales bacterium]|nr:16S rRNA (uracil(1498)-N(3))-methyltransferase [Pseudomonadales bacterium]
RLNDGASHYLLKVLRLNKGHYLHIFNGNGGYYEAEIIDCQKNVCHLLTKNHIPIDNESPASINLAIGISRSEKMDFIFQKCTELGVTSFTPVITEYSEFKLKGDRLEKKLLHWKKIIISACEQSRRNRIPELLKPVPFDEYLLNRGADDQHLMLDHRATKGLVNIATGLNKDRAINFMIGPEGGFSEYELLVAEKSGFHLAHLGPRVLRTETAPVATMAILQSMLGDFSSGQ